MAEERQNQDVTEESLSVELWRMWAGEIKPYFSAEAEFLQKHGEEAGYDRDYIGRVLADHRLMEELVLGKDDQSVARFAKVLAAHVRYKQAFFEDRVRSIVEFENTLSETPTAGQHS